MTATERTVGVSRNAVKSAASRIVGKFGLLVEGEMQAFAAKVIFDLLDQDRERDRSAIAAKDALLREWVEMFTGADASFELDDLLHRTNAHLQAEKETG